MKLHHIAFWTKDIDRSVEFYKKHFQASVLFRHTAGDFSCVFIELSSGTKIEIMTRTDLSNADLKERTGYSHFSLEVDSKEEVDRLTDYFIGQNAVMKKVKEQYEDGFYESAVCDPDGNIIELAYVDRIVNPNV